MPGRGVAKRNEQAARVLHEAEDRQLAPLAVQSEPKPADAPVAHSSVLTAGVDEKLAAVTRLERSAYSISRIEIEIVKAGKRTTLVVLDGRLRVRAEQLVPAGPESFQCIRSGDAVQVADAPAPVDQVEIPLG